MFFIVSTGRCGSTTIANYLSQAKDVICKHEPYPQYIIEAPLYHYGQYNHRDLIRSLQATRKATINKKQYGESNHNLSYMIPALKEAFPTAKFIWLIRNAQDCIASMHARGWYSNNTELHEWEKWRITGYKTKSTSLIKWKLMSPFEKCCWHWNYKNQLIELALAQTNADSIQIKLEDINVIKERIQKFLSISLPADAAPSADNRAFKHHSILPSENWSNFQLKKFKLICGDNMDRWYPEMCC